MAQRSNSSEGKTGGPTMTPAQGIELLRGQIVRGEALLATKWVDEGDYEAWVDMVTEILLSCFHDPRHGKRFADIGKYGWFQRTTDPRYWEQRHREALAERLKFLGNRVELLKMDVEGTTTQHLQGPVVAGLSSVAGCLSGFAKVLRMI